MKPEHVVIVGLGGVGGRLADVLAQYMAYELPAAPLTLIDGDNFEPTNASRQVFGELGNKAEVRAAEIARKYSKLTVEAKPRFLTPENVFVYVKSGCAVFSCADDHHVRKLLSGHCATLQDCILVSGGNEFDDGNVQLYIRKGGKEVTEPLTRHHPEIAKPVGKPQAELSCEERAALGSPQLIFANMKVASEMANAFWVAMTREVVYDEVYFDLKTGAQRPVFRTAKQ